MGSNLVIVAIPDENDRVWKVSSEKVPHLTLLYLGDSEQVSNVQQIVEFVEHAASTTLQRFYLPVDRRDKLGADDADVLFFKKGRYDFKAIRDFRATLLKDNNIKTAYDSATQIEGPWLPHLTLGYPATPAKPDTTDRDFGFYDVGFVKIAVWIDDYDGPEFLLKDYWDELDAFDAVPMDMAMSSMNQERVKAGAKALEHYGTKGMKWGVRKAHEPYKGMFDPSGHDKTTDLVKAILWPAVPPLGIFAVPAQVRLARAAARGTKAKVVDLEEKRFQKKAQTAKNFVEIHNRSGEQFNREIGGINSKHPGDLTKDPKAQANYDKDVLKLMQDSYKGAANSIGNKSNTMHLDVEFRNDGMDFAIKAREGAPTPLPERIQHAAGDDGEVTFTGKIKRDATGHIVGFEFDDLTDSDLVQTAMYGEAFVEGLLHYGVKGMHWGQRKAPPSAVTPNAMSHVPHGDKRKTKIKVEGGENHPAHEDAIKVAQAKVKLAKSGPAALSNKELRDVAQRIQLEQQVRGLVRNTTTIGKGRKFVKDLTGLNKEVNDTVGTGIQSVRLVEQVR